MSTTVSLPPLYCALDTPEIDRALALAAAMERAGCGIKIGLEFFNRNGPQGVREVLQAYPDLSVFLDLKFHDIPNTVAAACRAVAPLGADFVNLHASGGLEMMRAAREAADEAADKAGERVPRLLGVTILTSLDEAALSRAGFVPDLSARVVQLAALAQEAGLDGVVCSAHEIDTIRAACGPDFVLMVPGLRPAGSPAGDQKRVMTPCEARHRGATHMVVGRPITQADDPAAAAAAILDSLDRAAA